MDADKTFVVTVRKVMILEQTYTVSATSKRNASKVARELANDVDAYTTQTEWRVKDIRES